MQQLANFDWHIASRGPSAVAELLQLSMNKHEIVRMQQRMLFVLSYISTKDEK